MIQLPNGFKQKVQKAILHGLENYGGSDGHYATKLGINSSSLSRIKNGDLERVLSPEQWLNVGRLLDVSATEKKWKIARTTVYETIEQDLKFCKRFSKAIMLTDECGIGKTFCSKHVVSKMSNGFYMDCSQTKTAQLFVRTLARIVGVDNKGRYAEVKANLKYYLNILTNPVIVLDDAGYVDYNTFLVIQELWNASEGHCGWYMIGDDSLREKMQRGINNKKIGFNAIFSRFNNEYTTLIPVNKEEREQYVTQLIGDVARVNAKNQEKILRMINKCKDKDAMLRYLRTLIEFDS